MWWSEPYGAFRAYGIFGQSIYINPSEQVVIVVWSAQPKPTGSLRSCRRRCILQCRDRRTLLARGLVRPDEMLRNRPTVRAPACTGNRVLLDAFYIGNPMAKL
jgi:CubicO group peptidase (beta-lactamase class C family)